LRAPDHISCHILSCFLPEWAAFYMFRFGEAASLIYKKKSLVGMLGTIPGSEPISQ